MSYIITGIDPGSRTSAFVSWDVEREQIISCEEKAANDSLLLGLRKPNLITDHIVAIEQIRGYGIVAGDDTFDTCEYSGRFREAHEGKGGKVYMIPRKDIKRHLCGNTTTNDKYIRQSLIDRLGGVGTKKQPGKLYGISGHLWSALAVAITTADRISDCHAMEEACKVADEIL